MSLIRTTRLAGMAVLLTTTSAFAQVTPEEVWAIWQDNAAMGGYSLKADSARREGDRLVLNGVVAIVDSETTKGRSDVGQIVMRDRGDGTVEVITPPTIELKYTTQAEDQPIEGTVTLESEGQTIIVSGTKEAPRNDLTAKSVAVTLGGIRSSDTEGEIDIHLSATDVKGHSLIGTGDLRPLSYAFEAANYEVAMAGDGNNSESVVEMSLSGEALKGVFEGVMPAKVDPDATLEAMIGSGMRGKGSYTSGPIEFTITGNESGSETNFAGNATTSTASAELTDAGIGYSQASSDISFTVSGEGMPFGELAFGLADYRLAMTLPLIRTPEAADFGLVLRMVDLSFPSELLDMFDPQKLLARTPATIILDASGKARLTTDLSDPSKIEGQTDFGELHNLDINELQVKAAGADLTGKGSFTFDNNDLETFGGMPRPTGGVDLKLVGGNGLIDNLVKLGLLPEDQVMVTRMMLAMFARPGDGPDTLVSRLEITPEGEITANGQRLQ